MAANPNDERRRWTLHGDWYENQDGETSYVAGVEDVAVMSVSEHEAAMEASRIVHTESLDEMISLLRAEHQQLRTVAQAAFDAAGNSDDSLGIALINLGLVLAGEKPNV